MAVKTQYICDRCGHSQENNNQMWDFEMNLYNSESRSRGKHRCTTVMWCRTCVEHFGWLPRNPEKQKENPLPIPTPSLEDLIREIVKDELSNT